MKMTKNTVQPNVKPKYFSLLDGIRGIAAVLIVFRHIPPYFGMPDFVASYLAVDLFFVISGIVVANAYDGKLVRGSFGKSFCLKRLIRLYPMYLLSIIIALAINLSLKTASTANILASFSLALFFIPNLIPEKNNIEPFPLNNPTWSLFFELAANFVYAYIAPLLDTKKLVWILFISFTILVLSVIHYGDLSGGWAKTNFVVGAPRIAFSFTAGILISRFNQATAFFNPKSFANRLAASALVVSIAGLLTVTPPPNHRALFDLLAVTVVFPAVIYASCHINLTGFSRSLAEILGAISYPIYVIHAPLLKLFAYLCMTWRHEAAVLETRLYAIGFIISAGMVSYFLDRNYDLPIREFLNRKTAGNLGRANSPKKADPV